MSEYIGGPRLEPSTHVEPDDFRDDYQQVNAGRIVDTNTEYGDFATNVKLRFYPYRHAEDGRNIHDEAVGLVDAEPGHTVLDVGCGDGEVLESIANMYGQDIKYIGVDNSDKMLDFARTRLEHLEQPFSLAKFSANQMGIKSHSVDRIISLFSIYHVAKNSKDPFPETESTLVEFDRIAKHDAKIIIATSGENNKQLQRQFERDIANYLGVDPPPIFAKNFNAEIARILLPKHFEVDEQPPQLTDMVISTKEDVEEYILSLVAMNYSYRPMIVYKDFFQATTDVVLPRIMNDIEKYGSFRDKIERYIFECKPKVS